MAEFKRPTKAGRYWSKRGPEGPWDYIVIGSGMGGMTAAALLSKLGRRVLVVEQHYIPGGFTHTFKRPGYIWDVGVHAVGEVTEHTMVGRLLSKISDGRLKWTSLGNIYEEFTYPDNFRIDFPDNPRAFREAMVEAFPDEEKAIDQYLLKVREVAGSMRGYYLARAMPRRLAGPADALLGRQAKRMFEESTMEALDSLTDNPQLRSLFVAQWGYYGSPPSRSSFAMQALVTKHFMHGGYYPVGGSQRIAQELLRTVADGGGWTRVRADVDEILVENERAVGVRLSDGEELRAERVISAVGVQSTATRLLPQDCRDEEWVHSVASLRPGPAHLCLYMGFKGDIRQASASGANKWFYETWDTETEAWNIRPDMETLPECPILYCSFPSLKDPEHDPGPEQRHTGEIVTFVPFEVFEAWRESAWKKRDEDYDAFKQRITDQLLKQFFAHVPELESMLDFAELGTPLSTEHFVRPMAGSIYGLEPTPERFRNRWLRARAPIDNLYFAGAEVTSVGVIGAMMGGVLAALTAEPMRGFQYMRALGR